jgi:hypothetical protein
VNDALSEAGYDGILVVAFFMTPLLYFAFCATALARYCRAHRARRAVRQPRRAHDAASTVQIC